MASSRNRVPQSRRLLRLGRRDFAVAAMALVSMFAIADAKDGAKPVRRLEQFFAGQFVADGEFRNFVERTHRTLHLDIHGSVQGNSFVLVEDSIFSDGERHHYVWTFERVAAGRYVGCRADLIGDAQVVVRGDTMDLSYKARVPMRDGGSHDLDFREHFTFTGPETLNYRMKISLSFVQVGEAKMTIRRLKR
jgi:hypothetical protein